MLLVRASVRVVEIGVGYLQKGRHIYVVSSVFFFLQKCNPLFFFLYPRENPIMK